MKHLKTYESYELSDTEDPSISSAKINVNNMSQYVSEFNSQKNTLDVIYKTYIDQKDLRNKLLSKNLINKDGDGVSFLNPLLGIWAKISSKKRQIDVIEKSIKLLVDNKMENNKKLSADRDLKETIDLQNTSIDNSIKDKKKEIQDIVKEISVIERESTDKLNEIKKKLLEDTKTIGN